jgi:ABC-type lipoprotein release transport system permease subunit
LFITQAKLWASLATRSQRAGSITWQLINPLATLTLQMTGLKILVKKHLFAKDARPAVRWMNRFAVLACSLGLCAWLTTLNVMVGLQSEIRQQHLMMKPHLLLDGPLRTDLDQVAQKVREKLGGDLSHIQLKLHIEGLFEPIKDGKIFTGSGVVIEGSSDVEPGTLVMGSELSRALDAESMESFRLRNVWKLEGAPLELKAGGIRSTGLMDIDRFYVWVSDQDLKKWLGGVDYKSQLEVALNDPFVAPTLLAKLREIDPAFKDWTEIDSALWHSLDLEKKSMALSLFFVILFAALAVSSSISLRIAEKRREIGLLRAIGATQREIFWVFESEALLLAAFSFLLGVGLSAVLTWAIGYWGVMPKFFYSQSLPVDWSWDRVCILYAISLLTVAVASGVPARRLFKWDIASLLRS